MADRLTEEQILEFKEVFSQCDFDGDGRIPGRDIGNLMRSLGYSMSEGALQDILNECRRHSDSSDSIDFHDFLSIMGGRCGLGREDDHEMEDCLKEAFRAFDVDGNGFVAKAEVSLVLRKVEPQLSEADVSELIDNFFDARRSSLSPLEPSYEMHHHVNWDAFVAYLLTRYG